MIQYTGIYKAMFDKGWREINGSWANPDEVNSINGGHTMTTGDKGANLGLYDYLVQIGVEDERLEEVSGLLESLHKIVGESEYALRYKQGENVDTLRKALANIITLCADPISKVEGRA